MEVEIGDLPEEILLVILKEVVKDTDSFLVVAQVCSTWRRLVYDDDLRYFRGVKFDVEGFMKYDWVLIREWPGFGLFTDEEEDYILAKARIHHPYDKEHIVHLLGVPSPLICLDPPTLYDNVRRMYSSHYATTIQESIEDNLQTFDTWHRNIRF